MRKHRPILVADDSEADFFVLERAFQKVGIDTELRIVSDGQEAVDYLEGNGEFEDRKAHPLPQLLLLDLKMPRLDGFDVLRWLQQHPTLKRLPVTVLTSSGLEKDLERAYDLGANSYVVKPSSLRDYCEIVETLYEYWTEINRNCPDFQPD